jgi:hypothetical protein
MTPSLAILLVVTAVVYTAYELWQASHREPTISEQVWSFTRLWPPALFLAGVLAGHLFTH